MLRPLDSRRNFASGGHTAGIASLGQGRAQMQPGAGYAAAALRPHWLPARVTAEDAASRRAVPMDRSQLGLDGNQLDGGLGQMDVLVRHERSWSIQDALDQHAALAEQREVLVEIGRYRLRGRQTQLSFAQLELEDMLQAAKSIPPAIAGDTQSVLQKASSLRAAVRDLKYAGRQQQMEQGVVDKNIAISVVEIEKGRVEMTSLKEVIEDKSLCIVPTDKQQPLPKGAVDENGDLLKQRFSYCTNCKVGGHGQRFCEYFLERPNWRVYPHQKWFEDEKANVYHCPLGKKLVDFADESHFSRIAMYLMGRGWLEEKTKVLELAPDEIPETFIIKNGQWEGKPPPADHEVSKLPWFVKEADRNWGTSVHVCGKPSECMGLAKPDAVYVVQQHIKDPLLMPDGRKCHIKFYVLMVGHEDGVRWSLYTFKNGYLSISPNPWSPEDLSKETQVTIIRSERINEWDAWEDAYPKCKAAVGRVMGRAVSQGKLEGRLGKTQFEILSADFIVDTNRDVWLFEFNMSPVLKDATDSSTQNDADMIRGALHIVSPVEGGSEDQWDFVSDYHGAPPQPRVAQPPADASPATSPAEAAPGAAAAAEE